MESFWDLTCPEPNTGCWLWTRSLSEGYGRVYLRERPNVRAHVLAWELTYGQVPAGMCVLHRCDTRACCNPEHLFLGTKADNNADMRAKGRHAFGERHGSRTCPWALPRGEAHHNAKLTQTAVVAIRGLVEDGFSQREIGAFFGVNQSVVSDVARGKLWARVP